MTGTTRCKFRCNRVTEQLMSVSEYDKDGKYIGNKETTVYGAEMYPVTGTTEENKKFFASTPTGEFKVSCVTRRFEPGKEYFIDITEATQE
jgi:hypothetical protein